MIKKEGHLSESVEDYLEAILVLSQDLEYIRSVDVASYLGFSKASVSYAVKLLQEEGWIMLSPKKHLSLTEEGRKIAEGTYRRHVFFTTMLENIGVPRSIAEEDACRIEHIISEETFQAIRDFYTKAEKSLSSTTD